MYYNVAQLLKEAVGSKREYRIDGRIDSDDDGDEITLQGQLSIMRTDKGLLVGADLDASVRIVCSRCLRKSPNPMTFVIDEEYLPAVDINTGESVHVQDTWEGSFTIDPHHILDLTEAVRQYTLTNTPMKPLCREDCQGLCPVCGINKNEGNCSCQGEAIDSRLAPLLSLLEKEGR